MKPEDTLGLEEALFLDLLGAGHSGKLKAYGKSMLPWILPGQTLVIEPFKGLEPPLAKGDVVLAYSGQCLRVHRVVSLKANGSVLIKGDCLPGTDPMVLPGHVYGRVVRIEGRWCSRNMTDKGERRLGRWIARVSGAQGHLARCVRASISRLYCSRLKKCEP